jgi:hypothetical protein
MIDVTVPCEKCGAGVGFGEGRCGKCRLKLPREGREALHARLEAASDDYRELQGQIRAARSVLLIACLVHLAIAVIAFLAASNTPNGRDRGDALQLGFDMVIGVGFLVLWLVARRTTGLAMTLAALGWLGLQAALSLASPLAVFSGGVWIIWAKLVVAILILRGIVAAVRAKRFGGTLRRGELSATE